MKIQYVVELDPDDHISQGRTLHLDTDYGWGTWYAVSFGARVTRFGSRGLAKRALVRWRKLSGETWPNARIVEVP